ncbi:SDR family oxidoreductase [Desulfospira joergensenii]|uniref:SDR family oxidoreductase n=1 Tax=Desulfospira joergensenii TaxID=53329 RepID=UPI0003B3C543|nr:SDR family oxidoreductase [Desulfospira joergensenii]
MDQNHPHHKETRQNQTKASLGQKPVLVTGATGYVAGRLIPKLLSSGYRVRAMGRSLEKMGTRPWARDPHIQMVRGDIMDPASLGRALQGCGTLFYLIHSMISRKGAYRNADRIGARNMAAAAAAAKAEQIIYLGGLGELDHPNISRHLLSRNEVGQILQQGEIPCTVLRAAMILGSGSASFEILRYLAEHLPVMITPKWVRMPTQPIAISNVLGYLIGCLENPETRGKTFDIGGPDIVSYRDLFKIYADRAGIPRPVMFPVPILSPRLSSLWIHLVTPVPAAIARPLTQGLSLPTICTENRIQELVPQDLISCGQAIDRALDRVRQEKVDTCWADAGELIFPEWTHCGDSDYTGGTLLKCGYKARVEGQPKDLWTRVEAIGGSTGYYAADLLWKLRGIMDIFSGGVGLNRGRRSATRLRTGDALDFWRVLTIEPPFRLLLLAEMRMPGEALLEITITPMDKTHCEIRLLSRFLPRGIAGILYWYVLYPFHEYVFSRMLQGLIRSAGCRLIHGPLRFTPKISKRA